MVVTSDPEIAEKVTMLRNHGGQKKYFPLMSGFNSHLDDLQAAILRVKLAHLDGWIKLRRQKASLYTRLFNQIDGISPLTRRRTTQFVYVIDSKLPHSKLWGITRRGAAPFQNTDGAAFISPAS